MGCACDKIGGYAGTNISVSMNLGARIVCHAVPHPLELLPNQESGLVGIELIGNFGDSSLTQIPKKACF